MNFIKILQKIIEIYKVFTVTKNIQKKIDKDPKNAPFLVDDVNADLGKMKNVGVAYGPRGLSVNYKNTELKYNPKDGSVKIALSL